MNQKLKIMNSFDKEKACDELGKLMTLPPNAQISDFVNSMKKCQDYLNDIYLKGYQEGLEKNLSLTEENKN